MLYRFLGTTATLMTNGAPTKVLNQWGQSVELSETEARERVADHLSIMPDAEFTKAFSPEEIKKYALRGMHEVTPADPEEAKAHADFIVRRNKAWAYVNEWRGRIAKGEEGNPDPIEPEPHPELTA